MMAAEVPAPTPTPISSIRATKRKLEDAIQSLDVAVSPSISSTADRPPLAKRPHVSRSLYSTLAKYGIESRADTRHYASPNISDTIDLSKSAPHLTAILARTASRSSQNSSSNSKTVTFKHPSAPPFHAASEYRPSSTQFFLSRLATFKLATYANKPSQIDAVAAAKCGWINDGKDRLVCGICNVSWVLAGRDGMTKEAANALVEKQRASLVEMHKEGCPWKSRQCDDSVYRVPLQSPSFTARELRTTAIALDPIVSNIVIKHPLASSQLSSLRLSGSTAGVSTPPSGDPSAMQVDDNATPTSELSDTSFIVALFGWQPAPSPSSHDRRPTMSISASRAGLFAPSASMPTTPALSRASSVSRSFTDGEGTLTRTPGPPASPRIGRSASRIQLSASPVRPRRANDAVPDSASVVGLSTSSTSAKDMSLVHCPLCQRRVGLWSFATVTPAEEGSTSDEQQQHVPLSSASGKSVSAFASAVRTSGLQSRKPFDVLKEHRSYCPYVVRSTVVPSLPSATTNGTSNVSDNGGGLVEGWRAMLTVIQRHKLSQRQRMSRFVPGSEGTDGGRDEGLEGVEAMVAGVKSKGGKDLLRYIKGLLS
ncbi:C3HC zinc finger-like-domain-containing protein [Pisolithus sp. B1]|nr:C3HC zinc finger-like-domain-containing protein [Pisolithus sp. B1]